MMTAKMPRVFILIIVGLLSSGIPGCRQEDMAAPGFDPDTWVKAWEASWNNYDLTRVDELFLRDDRLTYFSSEREGLLVGFQAVRDHHASFGFVEGGKIQYNRLWLDEIQVREFRAVAVVTAIWVFQRDDGTRQQGPVSMVWVPEDGAYRIAHMNFSEYPGDTTDALPAVPERAQAVSLQGAPLYASEPDEDSLMKLKQAEKDLATDPDDPDLLIWLGRRTAYTGDYRGAIRIFSQGVVNFPQDARFYRHRGHRYITIREFERAIEDFEQAAALIEGEIEDEIEPDGMPNARNIPVSTLHTNIWYHLGLAYYLKHDLKNAYRAYKKGIEASKNDDMLVATTHWLYMTLRLMGREEEARDVLRPIHEDMDIIENTAYYRLCLFYKGELDEQRLSSGTDGSDVTNDASAYGLANWLYYNGRREEARKIFEKIINSGSWASFGHIAAEAVLVREFGE